MESTTWTYFWPHFAHRIRRTLRILLVELYAGDWPLNREATLNTDEQPWVEFNSPISNKSDQLLCGARLRNYLRDRVERYLITSLQYHQIEGAPTPLNRNWQRLVMFPEP